jgi:hypothetical protein
LVLRSTFFMDYISLSRKEGLNTLDDFLDLELIMVNWILEHNTDEPLEYWINLILYYT